MQKVAIIGAGASGLVCAIELAKKNYSVTLFEKNNKLGKKLLATGNGRCNISNINISKQNYHSFNIDFIDYFLQNFSFKISQQFFQSIGIEFITLENGKTFPYTLSSHSVVELLEYELKRLNINIIYNCKVENIEYSQNKFIIQDTIFHKLILATGSYAMPKLGGSNSGYNLAKQLGHTIIEPFATLVQLVVDDNDLKIVSGLKIKAKANSIYGDLLFTNYGLSGNMILDISRDISYNLQFNNHLNITIDTMPNLSKQKLISILEKRLKFRYNKTTQIWLDGFIHKKLAKYIIKKGNLPINAHNITKKDILKIVFLLKNLSFKIIDTKGFEFCEVCGGGVDTTQINPKTFQSKLIKNLYILGELLDIDGDCGGYNLHFAFGSGFLCAKNL